MSGTWRSQVGGPGSTGFSFFSQSGAVGDLLIAVVIHESTITPASGWTAYTGTGFPHSDPAGTRVSVYYKYAASISEWFGIGKFSGDDASITIWRGKGRLLEPPISMPNVVSGGTWSSSGQLQQNGVGTILLSWATGVTPTGGTFTHAHSTPNTYPKVTQIAYSDFSTPQGATTSWNFTGTVDTSITLQTVLALRISFPLAVGRTDLFADNNWRMTSDTVPRSFESGFPPAGGPAGWHDTLNFDDSGWATKANGAGSVSAGVPEPDGRPMPSAFGQNKVFWRSTIEPNRTHYARATFQVSAEDLAAGVYVSSGAQWWGTLWINGVQVHNAGGTGAVGAWELLVTQYCTVGTNLIALRSVDDSGSGLEGPGEAYGDGKVLDTMLWAWVWSTRAAPEVNYVIGGPQGDWSYRADPAVNPPGGIVEKGWPRGKRTGYADGVYIWDENFYEGQPLLNEISNRHVTVLDEDWAIAVYGLMPWTIRFEEPDDMGTEDRAPMMAALLKREGDALVTVKYNIFLDWITGGSYTLPLTTARLTDTDIVVGFQRWERDVHDENDNVGGTSALVARRVGEDVEVVGRQRFYTAYEAWAYGPWYGTRDAAIERISDNKWVMSGPLYLPENGELVFDDAGGPLQTWTPGYGDMHTCVIVAEINGTEITSGPPVRVGFWEDEPVAIAKVNDDRLVILSSYEQRAEFMDEYYVASRAKYEPGYHLRTFDVDGLTLTENKTGVHVLDPEEYWGNSKSRVVMLSADEGVVFMTVQNEIQEQMWWHHTVGSRFDPNAYEHAPPKSNYTNAPSGSGGSDMPIARRFSIDLDGSVSLDDWKPHTLDASPFTWVNRDYYNAGFNRGGVNAISAQSKVFISGAEVEDDAVFVTWLVTQEQPEDLIPGVWSSPMRKVWRGTWIQLDDESPSGLTPTGYRHLGFSGYIGDDYGKMDLKRFRNTDYMIASIPWDGRERHYDGPGLSPEYYPGYPEHDPTYAGFWPDDTTGGWEMVPWMVSQVGAIPKNQFADLLAMSTLEDANALPQVPAARYQDDYYEDIVTLIPDQEGNLWEIEWNGFDFRRKIYEIDIWKIPHPRRNDAKASEPFERVMRPNQNTI